jgi:hypothetical protein
MQNNRVKGYWAGWRTRPVSLDTCNNVCQVLNVRVTREQQHAPPEMRVLKGLLE